MTDREKVIKGLSCCAKWMGENDGNACDNCPYHHSHFSYDDNDCYAALYNDAIALLKEQEPRVMTMEEVKAFGWDYCYLEEERLTGKEYRSVCGDYMLTCITWPCITSMRMQHGDDSYGKKWRCWSAKPTDEQRQEVKWE